MRKWKCTVCDYIHEGESPPARCPVCGHPAEKFVEMTGDLTSENIQDSTSKDESD